MQWFSLAVQYWQNVKWKTANSFRFSLLQCLPKWETANSCKAGLLQCMLKWKLKKLLQYQSLAVLVKCQLLQRRSPCSACDLKSFGLMFSFWLLKFAPRYIRVPNGYSGRGQSGRCCQLVTLSTCDVKLASSWRWPGCGHERCESTSALYPLPLLFGAPSAVRQWCHQILRYHVPWHL